MLLRTIQNKLHEFRGQQVMLDCDLAELYGVETRALKQAVKRNIDRFPSDFMYVLSENEIDTMVSQNVIPSKSYFGGALIDSTGKNREALQRYCKKFYLQNANKILTKIYV